MEIENIINTYQGKNVTQLLNLYTKHKKQLINTNINIYFNKKCLLHDIQPKYTKINIKNNNYRNKNYIKQIQVAWIKDEIKYQYAKINILNKKLLKIHIIIANKLEYNEWNKKYKNIEYTLLKHKEQKIKNINKKLEKLIETKNTKEQKIDNKIHHTFHPKLINLTNIKLSKNETEILITANKTNYPKNNKNMIENLLVETEDAINKTQPKLQDEIRSKAINHITNYIKKYNKINIKQKHKYTNNIIKNIKHKLKSNNATIAKVDKSNATVIIDKNKLEEKTYKFIEENNCIKLNKDPTNKYNTEINNILKTCDKVVDTKNKHKYIIDNPKPPKLNSLIKIHKKEHPIRPLINSKTSPNYKFAKIISKELKNKLKLNYTHNIKNTIKLTELLKTIPVTDNTKLFSFDITNMYTNIPIAETIKIIKQKLTANNETSKYIQQITKSIQTILNQNYFEYNNNIYKQTDGLAMGAPTSSIISEIYLQEIDQIIIKIIKKYDPTGTYYRYVDDTIYISQNKGTNIDKIITEINNIHKKLKFTIEEEKNNKLNYLDITITRNINKFTYTIYRKPTQTDMIIPYKSIHPHQHKMAAFYSMLYRMLKIPMNKEDQEREKNIIKQIAKVNGYQTKTINKIENKIKQKINKRNNNNNININPNNNQTENTYATLTYYGYISNKIAKLFNNTNIKIAYKTDNKIIHKITHDKELNQHDKNGIYKIECTECNKYYIGQTKKKLKNRYAQHLNAFKKPHIYKSNLATHAINNNHNFPPINNMTLIKTMNKSNKMNIWENLEIFKHHHNNTIIKEQTQIKTKQDEIFKLILLNNNNHI